VAAHSKHRKHIGWPQVNTGLGDWEILGVPLGACMSWIWFVPQKFMCWKPGPQYGDRDVAEPLRGGA
jgi:hypothetical protein